MKTSRYHLLVLYALFCAITFFLYRHCVQAHFLDDSLSALYQYKLQGIGGFLNSFGFPSLYYAHDFFYLGFYFLFGLNGWAWQVLFVGLHCLNALLIFMLIVAVFRKFSFRNGTVAAIITCLFFLVSPYQTENIIWVATMHYQIGMLCLLGGMSFLINERNNLWLLHLVFVVSLLTLEISLVFPALWVITFAIWRKSWTDAIKRIAIPQAAIIVLYFLCTKFLKGSFFPHYGADHISGWSLFAMLSTLLKYYFKIFGFVHFMEYPTREKIYGWCDSPFHVYLVWISVAAIILLTFKTKFKKEAKLLVVAFLFVFFMLLPVLNMYFMFLNQVENDRLSFFATPFLYFIPAFILSQFPVYIFLPATIVVLGIMKKFLGLYTWFWINAAEVQQRTLDTYKWFDKEKVYILNLPQNFGGAYIYRKEWRFGGAMLVKKNHDISKQIKEVAGQNMYDMDDGVKVTVTDSVTYDVSKRGWGWFWNGSLGAHDYETEDFSFKLHEYTYIVKFKHAIKPNEAVIYQNGGNWEEAK